MDACRSVGLASRFASGYTHGLEASDNRDLHAWAEVYLPGAGWRGYDPSFGLVVADEHLLVAAAHTAFQAAPTTGSFRSQDVASQMQFALQVRTSG